MYSPEKGLEANIQNLRADPFTRLASIACGKLKLHCGNSRKNPKCCVASNCTPHNEPIPCHDNWRIAREIEILTVTRAAHGVEQLIIAAIITVTGYS